MEIRFVPLDLQRIDGLRFEAAALPLFEDERPLRGAAGLCDWRLCGRVSRVLQTGRVTGARGEVTLLPARPRLPFDKLVLFGLGPRAAFTTETYDQIVGNMLTALQKLRLRTFVLALRVGARGRWILRTRFADSSPRRRRRPISTKW
jgi:hypothetical protein